MKYAILNRSFLFCTTLLVIRAHAIIENAGILPYTYNQFGDAYFLIGKEKRNRNVSWWSDFGGHSNKNETPQETAVREFYEETRYVYKINNIKKWVNESEKIKYQHIDHKGELNTYTMFLVHVNWISANIFLLAPSDVHSEKIDYAWVLALEFLNAVQQSKDIWNTKYTDILGEKLIRSHFCRLLKESNNIETIKKILDKNKPALQRQTLSPQKPAKIDQKQDPQKVNRMLQWYYGIKSYFSTMYSSFRTFLKRNLGI